MWHLAWPEQIYRFHHTPLVCQYVPKQTISHFIYLSAPNESGLRRKQK